MPGEDPISSQVAPSRFGDQRKTCVDTTCASACDTRIDTTRDNQGAYDTADGARQQGNADNEANPSQERQ
jgi:hypothetical protein